MSSYLDLPKRAVEKAPPRDTDEKLAERRQRKLKETAGEVWWSDGASTQTG